MIPFWLKALMIGLLAAAIAAWGWTGGAASKQRDWDLAKAAQVAAQLAATEQARATEQALTKKVNDANTARAVERQKADRIASELRADSDRLRNEFGAFIRGTPGESVATCVERGEATGLVLSEAIRVAGTMAEAGEICEADKRALIAAWPR
jgi:hypothetical protein